MSLVLFEFQIEIFSSIFKPSQKYTCIETPNSCIQVWPAKFTFVKITSRYYFSEFMRFFLKSLNPFEIQTKFNFILFPEFLIQILLGI
jgi:hypothetical protein